MAKFSFFNPLWFIQQCTLYWSGAASVAGAVAGGLLAGDAASDAAETNADAQIAAARIAADAAKFRPVGVTTNFGSSYFTKDDKDYVDTAGYTLNPQLQQSQNRLMDAANGVGAPMLSAYIGGSASNPAYEAAKAEYEAALAKKGNGNASLTQAMIANPYGMGSALEWQNYNRNQRTGGGTSNQAAIDAAKAKMDALEATITTAPTIEGGRAAYDAAMAEFNQNDPSFLGQFLRSQQATAPLFQGAKTMMDLGNSYLSTSPQEQAQKYMNEQLALLSAPRDRGMADLQARLAAQGRLGVATGATTGGMMAAQPELEAYYNAMRQQDLGLAANSTLGGQQYATFGAGLVGSGGDMLRNMYGTQVMAYQPYSTAMGGAAMLESLGQGALDIGMDVGSATQAANSRSGQLLASGMSAAGNIMQPANSYSPWAGILGGVADGIKNYTASTPINYPQSNDYYGSMFPYTNSALDTWGGSAPQYNGLIPVNNFGQ